LSFRSPQWQVELVRTGRRSGGTGEGVRTIGSGDPQLGRADDRDEGRREDDLTTVEREELNRLRRENRQLKLGREILSKAAAWFARLRASACEQSRLTPACRRARGRQDAMGRQRGAYIHRCIDQRDGAPS
jgi:transposase